MSVSLELQQRMAALRDKARTENLSVDELKEAIAFLRQERVAMPAATAKSRTKAAPIDAGELLKGLGL